jgi:sugar phosphate isomerase/epimerase
MEQNKLGRRHFLKTTAALSGTFLLPLPFNNLFPETVNAKTTIPVYAHLWVYASRYPPDWDCTPIMEQVFSDLKYAGYAGVEMMEVHLRQKAAVEKLKELVQKHKLPVIGSSYNGNMWNREEHTRLAEDLELVAANLESVGGSMLGITVGDARRVKTERELDDQASFLKKAMAICAKHNIEPNLHNHTFEVENNMHDLKGTMARVPEIALGPDLNWLVRGGVDPVWFIKTYGQKMVYMHLRDQDKTGQWTEALGEGAMDFPAIAKALKEMDYKGKAAVELAFDKPPVRPVKEDWKISRRHVKNVFGW